MTATRTFLPGELVQAAATLRRLADHIEANLRDFGSLSVTLDIGRIPAAAWEEQWGSRIGREQWKLNVGSVNDAERAVFDPVVGT